MNNVLLSGLWQEGNNDRYVWYGADWPEFEAKYRSLEPNGLCLRSLDVQELDGVSRFAGVWEPGVGPQEVVADLTLSDLNARTDCHVGNGMYLRVVRSYPGLQGRRWAALWRTGPVCSGLIGPVDWSEFWNAWLAEDAKGNRLDDFDVWTENGRQRWCGIWHPGVGNQFIWMGASWSAFTAKDDELRAKGCRLVNARSYADGTDRLWAGVWRESTAPTRLVADAAEETFWSESNALWTKGLRLAHVHMWTGSGYAPRLSSQSSIRLHVKIVQEPTVSVARMIERMREVYEPNGFQIEIASVENINLPELLDVDAANCSQAEITAQQAQLFSNRNSVGPSELTVYFVRSTIPPYNGCAAHPTDRPGAVIASYATEWTLAHEIGHVLGLYHVADNHRLMTGGGTANIVDPPPDLIRSEIETILRAPYLKPL